MGFFDGISDRELLEELKKRGEENRKRREQYDREYEILATDTLRAALMLEPRLLNLLAPEHDLPDCSDDQPANGFYTKEDDTPGCVRCALLALRDFTGRMPMGVRVRLEFGKRMEELFFPRASDASIP